MIAKHSNRIYIIGMMASGKSTIGKRLASELKFDFIDMDEEIVSMEKMSIKDIFNSKGEQYFRNIEHELLNRLSQRRNIVISTGGGSAIYHQGIELMKRTGSVVWLKASLKDIYLRLKNDIERPLANAITKSNLSRLISNRNPIYKEAEIRVWNRGGPYDVVKRIISKLN